MSRTPTSPTHTRGRIGLRRRLPLLISALLIVVVASGSWFAHRTLNEALIGATQTRLASVAQRLAEFFGESARRALAESQAGARDSAYAAQILQPSESNRARVVARLTERHDRSRQNASYVLWTRTGERVAAVGRELGPMLVPPRRPTSDLANAAASWIGRLTKSDSGVVYQVVSPIVAANGNVVGYLAGYTTMRSGQEAAGISSLIGNDTWMMLGNATGDLWTDLEHPVTGPSASLMPGTLLEFANDAGIRQVGVALPIVQTPWIVMLGSPRAMVLGPGNRFIVNIAGTLALCLALGAAGAWVLSSRITTPLNEVTNAAEDVAQGDFTRRVHIARDDEIGRLARSFNTMAERFEDSTREQTEHARQLQSVVDELRESESRYRQLVEVSPDAVLVHRNLRILFANPAAATMLGTANDKELMGRSILDFVPPGERKEFEERVDLAQRGRLRLPLVEIRLLRADGAHLVVETASTPFSIEGESAALTVVRDVTARAHMEDRMRQAQKMEAVGQLAGGVAHDFNNLLTVITSYSGMLLKDIPSDQPAWADIKEIADAADRAAGLTKQLLAFSRQQVLKPQVVDLNLIATEMEKMLRRIIPVSIQFSTRIAPDLGKVNADPGQIEQVIMNLSVNARDAMPAGGSLTIETANVMIGEHDAALFIGASPGPYVQLTVSDTGMGISAEHQAHIFEPFYTTKEPGKGTGLGLSTVYGIVKQSGGHIWVYSEPGQGTIFKVYFPRVDADADEIAAMQAEVANSGGTETILLAEDEPHVRVAARSILQRWGYTVFEASSGAHAVEIALEHGSRIDVLLTDMVMPDSNGREIARRIRERIPSVAIVYMSGYNEETMLRQNTGEPAAVFVQKPFTPDVLTRKIREAIAAAQLRQTVL